MSGSNVGVWTNLASVNPTTGTRAYSATAYYLPNAQRPNLSVLTGATVEQVLLERCDSGWTATGVRFVCGEQQFTVHARKEVVLCGGSVTSPQLLELSGIGNPDVLRAGGIEIKVANPNVGENLQEHMSEHFC